MDEEKPRSIRSVVARMVCIFLALPLLYILSAGPAGYFVIRFEKDGSLWREIYAPALLFIGVSHLERPMEGYLNWWRQIAWSQRKAHLSPQQIPPAPPSSPSPASRADGNASLAP